MKIYVLTNFDNTQRRFKDRRMAALVWYLQVTSHIQADIYSTEAAGYLVKFFVDGDANEITWSYLDEKLKEKTVILKETKVFLG